MKKLAICIVILLLLTSCAQSKLEKYQDEFYGLFDTHIVITGYAKSEAEFERYSRIVYGELEYLHQQFDIYNTYQGINNLKTVNDQAGISPVKVDPVIITLLEEAKLAYEETDGAVNIALGAVLELWHEYREQGIAHPESATVPPAEELLQAAQHMSIQDIEIDKEAGTVYLTDPAMSLNVGAIAKGFAVQQATDKAREAGLTSGIINAGGNVCVIGAPAGDRDHWNVGVQGPSAGSGESSDIIDVLHIVDMSAVTSGSYQRYYIVDDVIYHHIIDPETMLPANQYQSVTVIHEDSTTAEILSTALFILPYDKGVALVESKEAQAMWVQSDGVVLTTEGYRSYSDGYD